MRPLRAAVPKPLSYSMNGASTEPASAAWARSGPVPTESSQWPNSQLASEVSPSRLAKSHSGSRSAASEAGLRRASIGQVVSGAAIGEGWEMCISAD